MENPIHHVISGAAYVNSGYDDDGTHVHIRTWTVSAVHSSITVLRNLRSASADAGIQRPIRAALFVYPCTCIVINATALEHSLLGKLDQLCTDKVVIVSLVNGRCHPEAVDFHWVDQQV